MLQEIFFLQKKYQRHYKEFEKVLVIDPDDGPAQTYVKRCGVFLEKPPEKDWDGVYTFTEKG